MGKGGLFRPARHKWLAKIISLTTPAAARSSVNLSLEILKTGRYKRMKIGPKRALAIVRALYNAVNRATASAKRKNLSPKERREFKEIARIYRSAAKKASKLYEKLYKAAKKASRKARKVKRVARRR